MEDRARRGSGRHGGAFSRRTASPRCEILLTGDLALTSACTSLNESTTPGLSSTMKSERERPWHKNASNLLVINSILAAISAIVIQTLVTQTPRHSFLWLLSALIALFFFLLSAEKTAESFTDDDVEMYISYSLYYNVGVFFLFMAVVGIFRHYANLSPFSTIISSIISMLAWIWGWGCDTLFLFCRDNQFEKWKDKIQGKSVDGEIVDQCSSIGLRVCKYVRCDVTRRLLRSRFNIFCAFIARLGRISLTGVPGDLPHTDVYTRLQPSNIHGVGVFSIRPIRKGTPLFMSDKDIVWVDEGQIVNLPDELKKLYEDFAIIKDKRYGCPSNFNLLTMSWYLNDSDNPNVSADDEYNMFALRDIQTGEELTIDSSKFSEQPYKRAQTRHP